MQLLLPIRKISLLLLSLSTTLLLFTQVVLAMEAYKAPSGGQPDQQVTNNLDKPELKESAIAHSANTAPLIDNDSAPGYLADIRIHTAEELFRLLNKVDMLLQQSAIESGSPVVFLLHGEEASALFKQNYSKNKAVVDLAARLTAFDVVDIKVCETWSDRRGLNTQKLQPFVGTVPYAPAEEERLKATQGYTYF